MSSEPRRAATRAGGRRAAGDGRVWRFFHHDESHDDRPRKSPGTARTSVTRERRAPQWHTLPEIAKGRAGRDEWSLRARVKNGEIEVLLWTTSDGENYTGGGWAGELLAEGEAVDVSVIAGHDDGDRFVVGQAGSGIETVRIRLADDASLDAQSVNLPGSVVKLFVATLGVGDRLVEVIGRPRDTAGNAASWTPPEQT